MDVPSIVRRESMPCDISVTALVPMRRSAAMLERGENPSTKATSPDAEPLLQMLAADAEDDRE